MKTLKTALACNGKHTERFAELLGLNPDSYAYKGLWDPRREGQYLLVTEAFEDGAILHTQFMSESEVIGIDVREDSIRWIK